MHSFRAGLTALLVGVALFAIGEDARSSMAIAASLDQLCARSTTVVLARPAERRSEWRDDRIVSFVRVRVASTIAGPAQGDEVWVRVRGGVVGDIGQVVEGEPLLPVGRDEVLFLRASDAGLYTVAERAQGELLLDHGNAEPRVAVHPARGVLLTKNAPDARLLVGRSLDAVARDIVLTWGARHAR
jgi:hypothetical protein